MVFYLGWEMSLKQWSEEITGMFTSWQMWSSFKQMVTSGINLEMLLSWKSCGLCWLREQLCIVCCCVFQKTASMHLVIMFLVFLLMWNKLIKDIRIDIKLCVRKLDCEDVMHCHKGESCGWFLLYDGYLLVSDEDFTSG